MTKGAEIILDYLIREKVPYMFGVCGHGILGLLDAAYDRQDEFTTITTHDERVAGFMADAYYRVAGRPVATYTSCGPGSVNLAMSVASAFQDSSAFLAITGNVPTSQFNRGPFQESGRYFQGDFSNVMRPYVKRTFQAYRPEMLPLIMQQAYALTMAGRPGPVHIDVPLDVFVEETDAVTPPRQEWLAQSQFGGAGDVARIAQACELLLGAERPVIVAGNGVLLARAEDQLRRFAEKFGIPVLTTPIAKGALPEDHELCLGPTGRNGTFASNSAAREGDVILALGTRFDDRSTSSWIPGMTYDMARSKLIHVEIDPQEIGRNFVPDVPVIGSIPAVLAQIDEALDDKAQDVRTRTAPWRDQAHAWRRRWESHLEAGRRDASTPIRPDFLVAQLNRVVPDDAHVLADVGQHHNWMVQNFQPPKNGRFLQAWGFAAMGFGVAGALGAQFAAPDRRVLTVCGDGGFLMHANAVATAVEYGLPVVWVVWNDLAYGAIYGQQKGFFGADREIATRFKDARTGEPTSPDYAAMAESMGAVGLRVERAQDFAGRVEEALALQRPVVLDVRVDASVVAPTAGSWDLPPLPAPAPTFR
ncbi:thiamine pyrophosphate-binding protein [Rhodococcus sp. NPDC057014]|uniref:thiamine pyrophosphate-binding protein n=1 Tax=Rhodococcus sp. NPDC057014 TaxID=3346000 RepID=UPI00362AFACB